MRCALECDVSAELVVGYCAGTLGPDGATAFERHMEFCDACCDAVAAQKAVWAALDAALDDAEWRALPVLPDFDRRLFQRIKEAENRSWWKWRALVPVAACAAIAALLVLRTPDSTPTPAAQPALQIEQVEHALDDMDMLNQLGAEI
jgi:anti-sigma-K factor RskA